MRNSICVLRQDLPPDARVSVTHYSQAVSFDVQLADGPVRVPHGDRGSRGFRQIGTSISLGPWGGPNAFADEAEPVELEPGGYAIVGRMGSSKQTWFVASPRAFARLTVPGLGLAELDQGTAILESDNPSAMLVYRDWREGFVAGSAALTGGEQRALGIFGSFRSSARRDELTRQGLGPYHPADSPHLSGLVRKGLIRVRRDGAMFLSAEGKAAYSNLSETYK